MEEIREFHRRSVEAFAGSVATVVSGDWSKPTPCAAWTVRDLVNHVVAEELWVEPLFAGMTIEQVGDRFDGDVLGPDPVGRAESAARAAVTAADGVDLDRTVHLSFGDVPARSYLEQLFADHVVHTWDLCAAIGAIYPLGADLVDACARWFEGYEDAYRAAGAVDGRPRDLPAAGLDRLLVMFGRDPAWQAPVA